MDNDVKKSILFIGGIFGTLITLKAVAKIVKYTYDKSTFKKAIDLKKKFDSNNKDIAELLQQLKTIKEKQKEVEDEMLKHFNKKTNALDPNWSEWKYYSEKQKNLQMLENNISYMITVKQIVKTTIANADYINDVEFSKNQIADFSNSELESYRKIYGDVFVYSVLLKERPIQPMQFTQFMQQPPVDE